MAECNHNETSVTDSRGAIVMGIEATRRKRLCKKCQTSFYTVEILESTIEKIHGLNGLSIELLPILNEAVRKVRLLREVITQKVPGVQRPKGGRGRKRIKRRSVDV
jgi:transcriptional regulator NrdR family protein